MDLLDSKEEATCRHPGREASAQSLFVGDGDHVIEVFVQK